MSRRFALAALTASLLAAACGQGAEEERGSPREQRWPLYRRCPVFLPHPAFSVVGGVIVPYFPPWRPYSHPYCYPYYRYRYHPYQDYPVPFGTAHYWFGVWPRGYWRDAPVRAKPRYREAPAVPPIGLELQRLGDSYLGTKQFGLAEAAYARSLRRARHNVHARVGRLVSMLAQRDASHASEAARGLVRSGVSLPQLRAQLTAICDRAGMDPERLTEDAARAARGDPSLLLLAAWMESVAGDPRTAAAVCDRSLASGAADPDLKALRERLRDDWGIGVSWLHRLATAWEKVASGK